jgi:hypothetical protein
MFHGPPILPANVVLTRLGLEDTAEGIAAATRQRIIITTRNSTFQCV